MIRRSFAVALAAACLLAGVAGAQASQSSEQAAKHSSNANAGAAPMSHKMMHHKRMRHHKTM